MNDTAHFAAMGPSSWRVETLSDGTSAGLRLLDQAASKPHGAIGIIGIALRSMTLRCVIASSCDDADATWEDGVGKMWSVERNVVDAFLVEENVRHRIRPQGAWRGRCAYQSCIRGMLLAE